MKPSEFFRTLFLCVFWSCSEHFGQGPRSSDFGAQFSGVIKCITNSTPPQKKTNGAWNFRFPERKCRVPNLQNCHFLKVHPGTGFFQSPLGFFFRCSVVFWRSSVPSRCFFNIGVAGAWDRWMFPVHKKKNSGKINRDIKLDNPPCSVGNKSSNGLFSIVVLVYQSVNIPTKQRIGQKHHVCQTSKVFW